MPPRAIVDTHLHLWDPSHFRISWLDGNTTLQHTYLADEFAQHSAGVDVAACVYLEVAVDAPYSYLEAVYINQLAHQMPQIQGIVAASPVEYGEQARAYYAALRAIGPRIKGVRRLFQGESDPNYAMRPNVIAGVQALAAYDLSFDICVFHPQLPAVVELVRQCPNVQFILDHVGKPDIKGGQLQPWMRHIEALAAHPNVVCKLSGMTTEADHQHWTIEDLRPYSDHVFAAFGEDRVLFGGDWPVSLQSTTYGAWVDTVESLISHHSADAQRKFWSGNARRVYRLG
jgi:L-fuconolactonase